jgi:hypothetical protein
MNPSPSRLDILPDHVKAIREKIAYCIYGRERRKFIDVVMACRIEGATYVSQSEHFPLYRSGAILWVIWCEYKYEGDFNIDRLTYVDDNHGHAENWSRTSMQLNQWDKR